MAVSKYIFENGIMRLNPQWALIHEKAAAGDFTGIKMEGSSMLQGDTSKPPSTISNPSMNVGSLTTGNNLLKDQANINYATDVAQTPYLPGQQDVLVDGAPVANPDFGKAAPDLGPSISDQFAENMQSGKHSSFLQTKKIDAPDTVKAKSIGAVAGAGQEIAKQISGESVGSQTTAGAVSMAAQGASLGFMVGGGPVGAVVGGAVGAVLGGFMSSKKAKKAEEAAAKAEKERKEKEKRMRTERAFSAKMSADQAAYSNLQQGIANALSKSNVKIRV